MKAQKTHPEPYVSQGEYQYLELLQDILDNGSEKPVFGNEATIRSVFGRQARYDLSAGFPLLTTKKVFLKAVIYELLWFLQGSSNIKYLVDADVHIWDEWAYKPYKTRAKKEGLREMEQKEFIATIKRDEEFAAAWGDIGNVYGVQWRKWQTSDGRVIDQLGWAINELRTTPYRKSIVVSAWNPEFIYEMAAPGKSMALPPCHTLFQFNVIDGKLNLQLYQRSADMFLGVPFNIASYSLFLMMIAQVTGLKPGTFVHTLGDAHIYSNHIEQVKEQLSRDPRPFPSMRINPEIKDIDQFTYDDFALEGYDPYPTIKGEVTVVGGF